MRPEVIAAMAKDKTRHEPGTVEAGTVEPTVGPDRHGLHQPGDLADEAHGPDDHGETHGHDDHAHAGDTLGPVDTLAWGALALGVGAGLLVALCLVITTQLLATTPA
jgi:hypothetical protein